MHVAREGEAGNQILQENFGKIKDPMQREQGENKESWLPGARGTFRSAYMSKKSKDRLHDPVL